MANQINNIIDGTSFGGQINLLKKADKSIYFIGQNLSSISCNPDLSENKKSKRRLWEYMKKGKSVKILICDINAKEAVRTWQLVQDGGYERHLRKSSEVFRRWQSQVDKNKKMQRKLEIRKTFFVPISASICNPDDMNPTIYLTPNIYEPKKQGRPVLQIESGSARSLISAYLPKYKDRMKSPLSLKITEAGLINDRGEYVELPEKIKAQYRVNEKIGSGNFKEVYKGIRNINEKGVAIKWIKKDPKNANWINEVRGEYKKLNKVNSSNVVKVFYFKESEDDNQCFIIEELCKENLRSHLKKKIKLGYNAAIPILKQIAGGLSKIHKAEIIHRDLKPENILVKKVNKNCSFKISDLGLAKDQDSMFSKEDPLGTFSYMSPEQRNGKELSYSSDIFSFGLIAYELLAGNLAIDDRDGRHVNELINNLPLREIITKCLKEKPKERYQNASELLAALNKIKRMHSY